MGHVYVRANSTPQTAPIQFNFHLVATLNTSADEARRRVNREVVTELGTGLIARDPELVVDEEKVVWRVPIVLSLPELGDMGTVGSIDVDARSGRLLSEAADRQRIIEHARRLFAGAGVGARHASRPTKSG
jgi:hypothetical protein